MVPIAGCESNFRQTDSSGTPLKGLIHSPDTGVYQINKSSHEANARALNLNLDTLYGNIEYAAYLYKTQGTKPWDSSKPCWGKFVDSGVFKELPQ